VTDKLNDSTTETTGDSETASETAMSRREAERQRWIDEMRRRPRAGGGPERGEDNAKV
jgi:hypothetical protein